MTDIFISYSRKDTEFVRQLYEALEARGHDAWVDWDDIEYAEDWWQKIARGIEGADAFVFVISPDSVTSKVCRDEVIHATANHKRVVPLLHRDLTDKAHHAQMHSTISRHNWLPFAQVTPGNVDALIDTLNRDPEHVDLHTRLQVRALEWEANGRRPSRMLRGDALETAEGWLTDAVDKEPPPTGLQAEYIAASRDIQRRNQRTLLIGVSAALVVTLALAVLSFVLFRESEDRLALAQARGTEVVDEANQRATQQALAERAEATAVRSAAESRALALAANANRALEAGDVDLALALALAAIQTPIQEAQNALVAAAARPGTRYRLAAHSSPVWSMALNPDETLLLTGSADPGELMLWDVTTGELLQQAVLPNFGFDDIGVSIEALETLIDEDLPDTWILAIHFTDDGDTAQIITQWAWVRWDVANWELIDYVVFEDITTNAQFTPAGETAYVTHFEQVLEVTATGERRALFSASDSVDALAAAERYVAVGTFDGQIVVWDREEETIRHQLDAYAGDIVQVVALSPDETRLFSSSAERWTLWDVETGERIEERDDRVSTLFGATFDARGETITGSTLFGHVVVLDADTLDETERLLGHDLQAELVRSAQQGRLLITGSIDQTVRIWDRRAAERTRYTTDEDTFRSVALSADGQTAYGGFREQAPYDIVVWDAVTGEERGRLSGHTGNIFALALNNDDSLLASASDDGTIRLWDTQTLEAVREVEVGGTPFSLNFNAQGDQLAYTARYDTGDYRVIVQSVESGEILSDITAEVLVLVPRFAADGETLFVTTGVGVGANDQNMAILRFDVNTGALVQEYTGGHSNIVLGLDLSPDGRLMVSNSAETGFVLWDVESGAVVRRFVGHADQVREVAFTPDGESVVSGSYDDTVRVWRVDTGEEIARFNGHTDDVTGIALDDAGRVILSGSADGTLRLWSLPRWTDDLPQTVRETRYVHEFTCQEREQYRIEPYCE